MRRCRSVSRCVLSHQDSCQHERVQVRQQARGSNDQLCDLTPRQLSQEAVLGACTLQVTHVQGSKACMYMDCCGVVVRVVRGTRLLNKVVA